MAKPTISSWRWRLAAGDSCRVSVQQDGQIGVNLESWCAETAFTV
jgi:hypothetical protein